MAKATSFPFVLLIDLILATIFQARIEIDNRKILKKKTTCFNFRWLKEAFAKSQNPQQREPIIYFSKSGFFK